MISEANLSSRSKTDKACKTCRCGKFEIMDLCSLRYSRVSRGHEGIEMRVQWHSGKSRASKITVHHECTISPHSDKALLSRRFNSWLVQSRHQKQETSPQGPANIRGHQVHCYTYDVDIFTCLIFWLMLLAGCYSDLQTSLVSALCIKLLPTCLAVLHRASSRFRDPHVFFHFSYLANGFRTVLTRLPFIHHDLA